MRQAGFAISFLVIILSSPAAASGPIVNADRSVSESRNDFIYPTCDEWKANAGSSLNAEIKIAADDEGTILIGGKEVAKATFGTDSGWRNIDRFIHCGVNEYHWVLGNSKGEATEIQIWLRFVGLKGEHYFMKHWNWAPSDNPFTSGDETFVLKPAAEVSSAERANPATKSDFWYPTCKDWTANAGKSLNAEIKIAADDEGKILIKGQEVASATFKTDSGWRNIDTLVTCGDNTYSWVLGNSRGGPTEVDIFFRFVGDGGEHLFTKHWSWAPSDNPFTGDEEHFVLK